jgi:hypothetical protein
LLAGSLPNGSGGAEEVLLMATREYTFDSSARIVIIRTTIIMTRMIRERQRERVACPLV